MDAHCICLRRNLSQSRLRGNAESLRYRDRWVISRQLLRKLLLKKPSRPKSVPSRRLMSSHRTWMVISKWKMKVKLFSELSLKLKINFKIIEHMLNTMVHFLYFNLSYSFGYQFIKRSLFSLHHVLQSPLFHFVFKHWEDKFNWIIFWAIGGSNNWSNIKLVIQFCDIFLNMNF